VAGGGGDWEAAWGKREAGMKNGTFQKKQFIFFGFVAGVLFSALVAGACLFSTSYCSFETESDSISCHIEEDFEKKRIDSIVKDYDEICVLKKGENELLRIKAKSFNDEACWDGNCEFSSAVKAFKIKGGAIDGFIIPLYREEGFFVSVSFFLGTVLKAYYEIPISGKSGVIVKQLFDEIELKIGDSYFYYNFYLDRKKEVKSDLSTTISLFINEARAGWSVKPDVDEIGIQGKIAEFKEGKRKLDGEIASCLLSEILSRMYRNEASEDILSNKYVREHFFDFIEKYRKENKIYLYYRSRLEQRSGP
jgi:hypothetical protein